MLPQAFAVTSRSILNRGVRVHCFPGWFTEARNLRSPQGENVASTVSGVGYEDRALLRRQTVGVDSSVGSVRCPAGRLFDELAASASAPERTSATPIPADNRGSEILSRMGWRRGDAIGANPDCDRALREPVGRVAAVRKRAVRYALTCVRVVRGGGVL